MKRPTEERADFLLEVGCEEIPAGMIARAARELQVILEKLLAASNLLDGAVLEAFGAPRRLVAMARGVRLRQPDATREVTGPPRSVAFDAAGQPTKAAESFAGKQGVPVANLAIVATPRGEYLAARQVIPGRPAMELLADLLPRAITEIPWPRSMYWTGKAGPHFIRPIRWIVALLGGKVVPLEIGGVRAGCISLGHRFLGKGKITIGGAGDYERKLRAGCVLARPEERRKKIEREIRALAARRGLRAHEDAALLEMVTYLNEYPTVILGDFEPGYLDLPDEILITVMRDHQKYFAVERKDGELAPHFLAVINLAGDRAGLVCAGHERVLRARFADARFFWETDQRCRLADYLPRLAHVTYESRLGSYHDKVERMRALARWLAEQWFSAGIHQASVAAADRAAELSKCDLATEMVREFTELQGIVGGLYAKAQGEPEEVVWAVYDHYRPASPDDAIPRNLTGCAVALADKLDALVGCFAAGLVPSGSSDPFALRRAALGVVRILFERKLPLSLSAAVAAAAGAMGSHTPKMSVSQEVQKQVLEFIVDRARFILRERAGFAYDEVNAALVAGADDLVDAVKRLEAVKAIRRTKNFEPLAVSFKRIRKILEKAGPALAWRLPAVRPELFVEDAEKRLHAAARRAAEQAGEHKRAARYREALQVIAELRPAVDQFFDDVMVMAEEEAVRRNRLTLLAELLAEFSTIADFSEITAGEK
jgi:glycyl-tRNA synthetase beta chain